MVHKLQKVSHFDKIVLILIKYNATNDPNDFLSLSHPYFTIPQKHEYNVVRFLSGSSRLTDTQV